MTRFSTGSPANRIRTHSLKPSMKPAKPRSKGRYASYARHLALTCPRHSLRYQHSNQILLPLVAAGVTGISGTTLSAFRGRPETHAGPP